MHEFVDMLVANWELVLIFVLTIDKIVALSPTKWDDLLWTSIKKALYKLTGKGK